MITSMPWPSASSAEWSNKAVEARFQRMIVPAGSAQITASALRDKTRWRPSAAIPSLEHEGGWRPWRGQEKIVGKHSAYNCMRFRTPLTESGAPSSNLPVTAARRMYDGSNGGRADDRANKRAVLFFVLLPWMLFELLRWIWLGFADPS